jgi:hypothetical protein
MTNYPEYLQISSPGQIPKIEVGFDLNDGDTIDVDNVTVTSSLPDYLTADDIAVSEEARVVDGITYPAGSVVEFTLVCAAGAPELDPQSPHYVYLDYRSFGDATPERLRWKKRCDIFDYLPLD